MKSRSCRILTAQKGLYPRKRSGSRSCAPRFGFRKHPGSGGGSGAALAGHKVRHLLRGPDDHVPVPEGFVGDHVLRIRAAPGRAHAFPVQPGVDQHAGAGLRQLRRPGDGPEGMFGAAVVPVRGLRGSVALDMQLRVPRPSPFPRIQTFCRPAAGRKAPDSYLTSLYGEGGAPEGAPPRKNRFADYSAAAAAATLASISGCQTLQSYSYSF